MKINVKHIIVDYVIIALGSVFYSGAVAFILEPALVSPGGITGIAVIIHEITRIPSGVVISLFNVPLIILGFLNFGGGFVLKTAVCVLMTSSFLDIFEVIGMPYAIHPVLAALLGGTLLGVGIGLVMTRNSTTGGVDIAVKILSRKSNRFSIGKIFLIADTVVIIIATLYYQNYATALYSLLSVLCSSVIVEKTLKSLNKGV